MKPQYRQLKIIDVLRRTGQASVDELASEFKTSPETIRRDLNVLAHNGKIMKVHGGALLPRSQGEGSFQQRMSENIVAKRIIAEKASKLISSGDTLFIDTGSTTLIFAEEIASLKDLIVVTNSTEIAKVIGTNSTSHVFLLGGEYNADNHETTGTMVLSQLDHFYAQHAILTIGSLSMTTGALDFNLREATIARAMLKRAQNSILLVDSSKFNRTGSFVVAKLNEFDQLVCDIEPDQAFKAVLLANDVEVI